jgi:hypothetical protein
MQFIWRRRFFLQAPVPMLDGHSSALTVGFATLPRRKVFK